MSRSYASLHIVACMALGGQLLASTNIGTVIRRLPNTLNCIMCKLNRLLRSIVLWRMIVVWPNRVGYNIEKKCRGALLYSIDCTIKI
jgi:hypothetical protein